METFGALRRDVVDANPLRDMVGPWGLEPQTSTVSILSGATVPEEGECESAIREDICGLAKGRRDLIVGSSSGGTLKPTERASGAKLSLAQSSNIRIWKTRGRRVTASASRSTKHAIVSVNRL